MTKTPPPTARVIPLGPRIRELRAARNLSQVQLAALVGRTQAWVSSIEGRRAVPTTWGQLGKVALALEAEGGPAEITQEIRAA